jgi:hypothetical protein
MHRQAARELASGVEWIHVNGIPVPGQGSEFHLTFGREDAGSQLEVRHRRSPTWLVTISTNPMPRLSSNGPRIGKSGLGRRNMR